MTTLPDLATSATPRASGPPPPPPKWPLSASLPGPVYVPGVSMRNPITGRGYVYSSYAWSEQHPKITPHHIKEHDRSVFSNTNFNSSFYVIHPDWTSEARAIRRIIAKERDYFSYDHRPAVQPMRAPQPPQISSSKPLRETTRDTYLPYLKLRARKEYTTPNRYYSNIMSTMEKYDQYRDVWNNKQNMRTSEETGKKPEADVMFE